MLAIPAPMIVIVAVIAIRMAAWNLGRSLQAATKRGRRPSLRRLRRAQKRWIQNRWNQERWNQELRRMQPNSTPPSPMKKAHERTAKNYRRRKNIRARATRTFNFFIGRRSGGLKG
jgi:hypothetical protein